MLVSFMCVIKHDYCSHVMGMEVQGRRRRGRPESRWVDRVKDDIGEKGRSGEAGLGGRNVRPIYIIMEAYIVIHRDHIKLGLR